MNTPEDKPVTATPEPLDAAGTVPVTDLDQFVRILAGWHSNRVARLKHLLKAPASLQIQVGDDAPLTLDGDIRTGFMAGIELALIELGELPFVAEVEDDGQQPT